MGGDAGHNTLHSPVVIGYNDMEFYGAVIRGSQGSNAGSLMWARMLRYKVFYRY